MQAVLNSKALPLLIRGAKALFPFSTLSFLYIPHPVTLTTCISLPHFTHISSPCLSPTIFGLSLPSSLPPSLPPSPGLTHTESAIVSSSVRTLRIIYESELAPSDQIFKDLSTARLLVAMISGPPLVAQSATTVLTKACQVHVHVHCTCIHVHVHVRICIHLTIASIQSMSQKPTLHVYIHVPYLVHVHIHVYTCTP